MQFSKRDIPRSHCAASSSSSTFHSPPICIGSPRIELPWPPLEGNKERALTTLHLGADEDLRNVTSSSLGHFLTWNFETLKMHIFQIL